MNITMHVTFIRVEQPGVPLAKLLRLVSTAIATREQYLTLIEARENQVDLHIALEHQPALIEALQRASSAGIQEDKDEIHALELWIVENQIKMEKLDPRSVTSSAELAARLLCMFEIMHTVLDNPQNLDTSLLTWRQRRKNIRKRIGS